MATRIMVINDTKEILELFELILSDEGYEVVLSSYGIEELQSIESARPDLLILDYTVGAEKNGWQLLQKLKMNKPTARIPIIVCTTEIRLAKEIEGYLLSKGIGVVPKPFDINDLLTAVSRALEMADSLIGLQELDSGTTAPELRKKPEEPTSKTQAAPPKTHKTGQAQNGKPLSKAVKKDSGPAGAGA